MQRNRRRDRDDFNIIAFYYFLIILCGFNAVKGLPHLCKAAFITITGNNIFNFVLGQKISDEVRSPVTGAYDNNADRLKQAESFGCETVDISADATLEDQIANILNNAFSGSYVGGDGVALCSTSHPLVSGGVNSHRASTDLNESALESAVIQIAAWTDERGLLINAQPRKLIIPPNLMYTAEHEWVAIEGGVADFLDPGMHELRHADDLPGGVSDSSVFLNGGLFEVGEGTFSSAIVVSVSG